jgi:acetyl-CoA carboxylase carboxyltransferase component/acetyl/propionyl-CoA carboxylase alpha subunit
VLLPGRGVGGYLDIAAVVAAAVSCGAEAVHPGYGLLSENAAFAQACAEAGLVFIGPSPAALSLFGDKVRAVALARRTGAPCLPGLAQLDPETGLEAARAFLAAQDGRAVMVKAVAGGGGRGIRRVAADEEMEAALKLCAAEARAAFGDDRLYLERAVDHARHVEVQVLGDGQQVVALGDRECTLQRRRQKIVEVAPAIGLPPALRQTLYAASTRLAAAADLRGLATVEFLLDTDGTDQAYFMEVNARLQVEHTVTEAVTGLDLVRLQIDAARGLTLAQLGMEASPATIGDAVELRVNLETLDATGEVRSSSARLTAYQPPGGPGVRVDGCGYAGYAPHPGFDSLLAKIIVHAPSGGLVVAAAKAKRAAREFRLTGPESNLGLLAALMDEAAFIAGTATTRFIETHAVRLSAAAAEHAPHDAPDQPPDAAASAVSVPPPGPGAIAALAPLRGSVAAVEIAVGDKVRPGQSLMVLEAMKMQHSAQAPSAGVVLRIDAALGDTVDDGTPLVWLEPLSEVGAEVIADFVDLAAIRPDLQAYRDRLALTADAARPEAIAKRHAMGMRTARENIDAIFDPGSFEEVGALTVAAQRRRRSHEDLQKNTPADGMVAGVGQVNGDLFGEDAGRCVGLAYDYTVLAGTQGYFNHKKTDRVLEFAEHWKLPVIWFVEGGGGRPGDVDGGALIASSLDTTSFTTFARLSGLAPRICVAAGRCFAGNAAFFGCADITIGVEGANIGMGGPAMIEGGGLGVVAPGDIGPAIEQYANGCLDLLVADEAEAASLSRRLLSVFQGRTPPGDFADQRLLRHLIPENRLLVYDIRTVIETLCDSGSFIELRGGYGPGMITGFLRIEGRALGVIANDPRHLGGAIDGEGAEKASRFLQLCDAFDVPILSLCDTPGFMVGPESERAAAVRRGSRLFVTATTVSVPFLTVVLRKGYGLGAQAMAGGDLSASAMICSWPTGEFGPMGFEGAVRLGYRKELEAIADPAERDVLFRKLVGHMYARGKAEQVAEVLEIDAVIDPADTRRWLVRALKSCGTPKPRSGKKRPFVDVW